MDDAPTSSVHKKRRTVFRHLKNVLTGQTKDKEIPLSPSVPSSSGLITNPGARNGSGGPQADDSKPDNHDVKNYWQTAYDVLTESDRNTLTTLLPAITTELQDAGRSRAKDILGQAVKMTEMQYQESQRRNNIWAMAYKILNCALSFQDVVDNTVKFDLTGYALSAWAIVSLGLTMAKNHADLRAALFDAFGYLADPLARCAFNEEQFYREIEPAITNFEKENLIVWVYVVILQYSAQLKASIQEEESHLHHWLLMDQYLHRKAEAEAILTHIDTLMMKIEEVHKAVDMLNLPSADGAFFDSFIDQHEDEYLPGT